MDGNRRFGRQAHGNSLQGHWSGGQTLVDFVQWCQQDGVQCITVYAFSTENWHRETLEVQTLMSIFASYAEKFKVEALARNVKVNVLSTGF
jgi:undecaprenyl diphosphate synthase